MDAKRTRGEERQAVGGGDEEPTGVEWVRNRGAGHGERDHGDRCVLQVADLGRDAGYDPLQKAPR